MLYVSPYPLEKKTKFAAGYDISADAAYVIQPKGAVVVTTGLYMSIPPGLYGMVTIRSGHGFKKDLFAHVGIIDSDYRGEVRVKVFNHGDTPVTIEKGERFAQLTFHPIIRVSLSRVHELVDETERGTGGFGSTGEK